MLKFWAFFWGSIIGTLGGLIGLGGAEFRLPVLMSIFKYRILNAVIINLIVSLVTVIFSFIFRAKSNGFDLITTYAPIIINILAGSLIGSYVGVHLATKINERILIRVVIVLLICLSIILIGHDFILQNQAFHFPPLLKVILGFVAGVVIGVFSSMLGVAGGELIIPTIILLFAVDIKLAGSLSLAISIPTIIMGIVKYQGQQVFGEIHSQLGIIILMSLGSIIGAVAGSYLLQYAPSSFLHIFLGLILLVSVIKLSTRKITEAMPL